MDGSNGLWQRNYYKHIIRDDRALHQIRQYIGYDWRSRVFGRITEGERKEIARLPPHPLDLNAIATAAPSYNLIALAANLSLISPIAAQELIQHHTLYRGNAPFVPQGRSRQALNALRSQDGTIHGQAGIRA